MIDESPKEDVPQETLCTPSKKKEGEQHNSTKSIGKLIEGKTTEQNQSTEDNGSITTSKEEIFRTVSSQDENMPVNSNILEKSNINTTVPKPALNIKKTSISPKKDWIASAYIEAHTKEESNKQVKTNSTNTSPQKCIQNHNDTNVNNINNDVAEHTNAAKTVITVIKIQHNSIPNIDFIDENKSPNNNLCNKDGPALRNSPEHTPQKLQKSPKKKSVKKDNDENTTKNGVIHEMSLDIVKSETHLAEDLCCDKSTDNNYNNEVVSTTAANVNIETLLLTPKKASEVLDQIKIEICKAEGFTGSPNAVTPNATYSNSNTYKKQNSNIQQTPQSSKTIKTLSESDSLKGSPIDSKIEKDSANTDSECLSDALKSELCDPDRINEFEAIDMLHDLDAVIDFEDSKVTACALLSPFSYDCFTEDISKKPEIDPLFIDPSEQKMQSTIKPKEKSRKRKKSVIMRSRKKLRKSLRLRDRNKRQEDKHIEDNINVEERMDVDEDKEGEEEEQEDQKDDTEKLRDLRVQLIHVPPPQHTLAPFTCVTRALTHDQAEQFQKYGPLKKGKFSSEEDAIIKRNWILFCETHGLNPADIRPFVRIRQRGIFTMRRSKDRQKFVQFLGNGLPWRSIYNIYNRFKQLHLCDKFKRFVPYNAEEDRKILSYVQSRVDYEDMNSIFSDLTQILGRNGKSLRHRYKLLLKYQQSSSGNQPSLRVKWSLPLIEKFIHVLIDVTLSESLSELKYAVIPLVVWKKCEEKINIDCDVLRKFWYLQLHMQLFCEKPIYLNDIKIALIEYMYGIGACSRNDIIWPDVVKYFDGMTTQFLQRVFYTLTGNSEKSKHFIEIIDTLYHEGVSKIQECETDRYLPRFNYNNGKLEVINDNIADNEQ